MAFELKEAQPSDLDEIVTLLIRANTDDEPWQKMLAGVSYEDQHSWSVQLLEKRMKMPDITYYAITEKATGKITAFTALQFPWSQRPLSPELKALLSSNNFGDLPTPPQGMDIDICHALFVALPDAKQFGYDAEKDFHRRGTMVLPEFQKKGQGTWLTNHCNEIADKTACKTWVQARSTSKHMFQKLGFREVGVVDAHMEAHGGDPEQGINFVLVREPRPF